MHLPACVLAAQARPSARATRTSMPAAQDGAHGKVWGQLTWSGQLRHEKPTQINGPLKKVWRLVGSPGASGKAEQQRRQQWQSFAAAALQQQGAEPAAAAAAEATQ